ncbi:hypothetical protein DPX39_000069600 [Trypanosoma brucei equiperdum]|uniref:Uncharacterized protein n=1 Tax=Trypanosoma brucei equiperdum TaxID=630700 RepID=A0A3L6KTG5_9TRYP|nr:hypothetical protein DPX39_000069600 [Trypanosoma brucei equiperdum]
MPVRPPLQRCTVRPLRGVLVHRPRPKILPLEAAVMLGEPHAIAASFLLHAHISTARNVSIVRAKKASIRASNNMSDCLQRVLSCGLSRDVLLCACAAAATPPELLPPLVQRHVRAPRDGNVVVLSSAEWRAFFLSMLRAIHSTAAGRLEFSSLALLCATCLAPSVRLGDQLARAYCGFTGEIERNGAVCANSFGSTGSGRAADGVVAFAACCTMMNISEGMESRDTAWMRLWADVQPTLQSGCGDGATTMMPNESWIRCQELHLDCLLRTGRHEDIRKVLSPDSLVTKQFHRMSDDTLAQLFVQPSLCDTVRFRVLRALLDVSRAKSEALVALQRSPFSRNSHLPSVTRSARMVAALLRCLIVEARDHPSSSRNSCLFSDVEALCKMCNSYALAQSLLPYADGSNGSGADRTGVIALLMKATRDEYRSRCLAEFVAAISDAVAFARDFARRGDELASAMVHACAAVLTNLFTLCSPCRAKHDGHRANSSGKRRAKPAWRLRLERDEAVRSHKYELLPGELPHGALSHFIAMLLADGFVLDGGSLGANLAAADFLDLNFYSLQLLGSLYHATRAIGEGQELADVVGVVESLYRRRRQVFGEDGVALLCARCQITTLVRQKTGGNLGEGSSGDAAPSGVKVMRKRMPYLRPGAADLDFLRSRSVIAAGGAFAVDCSVGVWLRKATVQVEA